MPRLTKKQALNLYRKYIAPIYGTEAEDEITEEVQAVVSASTLQDAVHILREADWEDPEQCAKLLRGESLQGIPQLAELGQRLEAAGLRLVAYEYPPARPGMLDNADLQTELKRVLEMADK